MHGPAVLLVNRFYLFGRSLHLKQLNIEVDIERLLLDQDDKCVGRMCRKCASNLVRLEKLKLSMQDKVNDGLIGYGLSQTNDIPCHGNQVRTNHLHLIYKS